MNRRAERGRGMLIAVEGLDGSGKTAFHVASPKRSVRAVFARAYDVALASPHAGRVHRLDARVDVATLVERAVRCLGVNRSPGERLSSEPVDRQCWLTFEERT